MQAVRRQAVREQAIREVDYIKIQLTKNNEPAYEMRHPSDMFAEIYRTKPLVQKAKDKMALYQDFIK